MNFKILSASLLSVAVTATMAGCETTKQISKNDTTENLRNVSPKSIVFEWQTPYTDMLNFFVNSDRYSADKSMFDIRDLNFDGTPELIISPNTEHNTPCDIYTFFNHEIVSLGQMGNYGTLTYLPQSDKKLINEDYVGSGFVIGKYAYIENGKLVPELTYTDNSSSASSGAAIVHKINDREVSLPDYDKILEPYKTQRSLKIGRKYSFGEKSAEYAVRCAESWGAVLSNSQKSTVESLLRQQLSDSVASGSDAGFEICDLNGDNIPEIVVSTGTEETNFCKVFYLSGESANLLDGDFGYKGRMFFDVEQQVFYALDSPLGTACWTLATADLSKFVPSANFMECGRKFILDEASIKFALL